MSHEEKKTSNELLRDYLKLYLEANDDGFFVNLYMQIGL